MLNKVALLLASLATAAVLAVGLSVAGFGPADPGAIVEPAAETATLPAAAPADPPVQVDTIYLTPVEKPKDITVTKVREAKRQGGEHEGNEHEGNDD